MSKDKDYKLVVRSNEDLAAVSLIFLHGNNIENYNKQDRV